ncbi:glycosyltransferase family 2 protein [Mesorhizobium atlanticum]
MPPTTRSPFLGRAVNSALAQGNAVTEIIVVDDCSTDATLELAEAMSRKDGRIKVVHLPKNAGPSVARNAGLEVASGDWVAILDADDAYAPGRVERLVTVAAAQDRPTSSPTSSHTTIRQPTPPVPRPSGSPTR